MSRKKEMDNKATPADRLPISELLSERARNLELRYRVLNLEFHLGKERLDAADRQLIAEMCALYGVSPSEYQYDPTSQALVKK